MGCVVYMALEQGLLTDKYVHEVPADSRAARPASTLSTSRIDAATRKQLRALNGIALERGQSLAQLAPQWVLRDPRITSAVIGASSVRQLDDSLDALSAPPLEPADLEAIGVYL